MMSLRMYIFIGVNMPNNLIEFTEMQSWVAGAITIDILLKWCKDNCKDYVEHHNKHMAHECFKFDNKNDLFWFTLRWK